MEHVLVVFFVECGDGADRPTKSFSVGEVEADLIWKLVIEDFDLLSSFRDVEDAFGGGVFPLVTFDVFHLFLKFGSKISSQFGKFLCSLTFRGFEFFEGLFVDDGSSWSFCWNWSEDNDSVSEVDGLFEVVGYEEDGVSQFLVDGFDERLEVFSGRGVKSAEWLVHEEDFWLHGQRLGNGNSLALPSREFSRVFVFVVL